MAKPSWLFWVVAVLAILWNAFGVYDYWMTSTGDQKYLKDFDPQMRVDRRLSDLAQGDLGDFGVCGINRLARLYRSPARGVQFFGKPIAKPR